jgi:hypothetical protein
MSVSLLQHLSTLALQLTVYCSKLHMLYMGPDEVLRSLRVELRLCPPRLRMLGTPVIMGSSV